MYYFLQDTDIPILTLFKHTWTAFQLFYRIKISFIVIMNGKTFALQPFQSRTMKNDKITTTLLWPVYHAEHDIILCANMRV